MSLDKSIASGKERRKPYRKSKAFDYTCRNHGSCSWCEQNRRHGDSKRRVDAEMKLEEYRENDE